MALQLEIVTPRGKVVDVAIDEVCVPGTLGEFGILEGHVPVLSALKAGILRYRVGNKTEQVALGGRGYVEIAGEKKVMVISDKCVTKAEVDPQLAKEELAAAQSRLADFSGPTDDPEYKAIEQQAQWAEAQLALLA